MKIDIKELKKLADQVKIEMSDEELEKIETAIEEITDKLDGIMIEDVDNIKGTRTSAQNIKTYSVDNTDDKSESKDEEKFNFEKKLNNQEEDYIIISKEGK